MRVYYKTENKKKNNIVIIISEGQTKFKMQYGQRLYCSYNKVLL